MAYENLLQSNQALVVVTMLAFIVASFVSRRGGVWGHSRALKKAARVEAARPVGPTEVINFGMSFSRNWRMRIGKTLFHGKWSWR
jgi:hypothetical protein